MPPRDTVRSARLRLCSAIQPAGSQPQPGLGTASSASSDWRDTQSGSMARSRFGSTAESCIGASCGAT